MLKFTSGDLKSMTRAFETVLLRKDTQYKYEVEVYKDERCFSKVYSETHWDLKEAKRIFRHLISSRHIVYRHNGKHWDKISWLDINLDLT